MTELTTPSQPAVPSEPTAPTLPEVLTFGDLLSHSFRWGFGQYFRILLALLLWVLTLWIPYVNVGTTIALTVGIPLLLSRQERIDPTIIFDRRYRDAMADWLLLVVLLIFGIIAGLLFFVIPGLVLTVGWVLAPLLLVDRGSTPTEALRLSWRVTLGEKWTLFFGRLAVQLLCFIPAAIIGAILVAVLPEGEVITDVVLGIYGVLAYAGLVAVDLGYLGYAYAVLGKRSE
ncbi:MAG: hypothetical protein NZ960_06525 [Candidatus Kapabacteria bacterium]|nr:hypothetical protein [Candidatus Kapabacteria bacterium]MDW8012770.1 hypothetical protein [Bacteroidota bacterium]